MKSGFLLVLAMLCVLQNDGSCGRKATENFNAAMKPETGKTVEPIKYERLPDNIKPETEVRRTIKDEKGVISFETTTVEKRLNELKARFENGKLIDGDGREIRFHELLCRGASRGIEGDEEDRRANENELAALEKKYTVLVVTCDPRKAL